MACLFVGLIPGVALWLLYRSNVPAPNEIWMPYLLAAAAGAAGAVFSIAMRIQDFDLKPCTQSVMNYIMGALRVLTGFVAGAMILFIVNGTIFGEGVTKFFKQTRWAIFRRRVGSASCLWASSEDLRSDSCRSFYPSCRARLSSPPPGNKRRDNNLLTPYTCRALRTRMSPRFIRR